MFRHSIFAYLVLGVAACTPAEPPAPTEPSEPEFAYQASCTMELRSTEAVAHQFQAADPDTDVATNAAKDQACAWLGLEPGCAAEFFPTNVAASYGTISMPDMVTVTLTITDTRAAASFTETRQRGVDSPDGEPDLLYDELLGDLCREAGAEPGCTEGDDPAFRLASSSCYVSS